MRGFILFLVLVGLILIAILFGPHMLENKETVQVLKNAYTHYKAGEKGQTVLERKENFNLALQEYIKLENEYHPAFGNGKLYYNIANTYFQLGDYPWSILYYNRALALMPRNEDIPHNLEIALSKLNLSEPESNKTFRNLFFFHYMLSLPERLEIFFFSGVALLLLISAFIWNKKAWLKYCIALIGTFWFIILLSLVYTRYFEPVKGVMVQASDLYRDAGKQYAKVIPKPISAGMKVKVLDTKDRGRWLKVVTPDGQLGYVPLEAIRIL